MKKYRVFSWLMIFFFVISVIPTDYAEARRSSFRSSRSSFRSRSYNRPRPISRPKVKRSKYRTPPPARTARKKTAVVPPSGKKGKKGVSAPPSGKKKSSVASVPPSGKKGKKGMTAPPPGKKGKIGISAPPRPDKKSIASRIPQSAADKAALKKRAKVAKAEKERKRKEITKGQKYTVSQVENQKKDYFQSHNYKPNPRIERYDTGSFDPGFIGMMALSGMGSEHPIFWASMSRHPWFTYWLLNSQKSANEEEKKRLAQIEKDIAEVKASGKQIPANYIPPGIPATVAYKTEVLVPEEVVMYTASPNGFYNEICEKGAKKKANEYDIKWKCKPTPGGDYNIKQFVAGKAKVLMAQADNIYAYQKRGIHFPENQFVTHQEPMWLITAKKSKIKDIEDIDENTTIYAMGGAYRSWKTLASFAKDDKGWLGLGANTDYAKAKVVRFKAKDLNSVTEKVAKDKHAVMFVVMGVKAQFLKNLDINHGKELSLIPINDDRFISIADPDGKRIYSECTVKKGTLPNLQAGRFWGQNKTNTLCVDAIWLIDDSLSSDAMTLVVTDTIDEL